MRRWRLEAIESVGVITLESSPDLKKRKTLHINVRDLLMQVVTCGSGRIGCGRLRAVPTRATLKGNC